MRDPPQLTTVPRQPGPCRGRALHHPEQAVRTGGWVVSETLSQRVWAHSAQHEVHFAWDMGCLSSTLVTAPGPDTKTRRQSPNVRAPLDEVTRSKPFDG